MEQSHYNLEKMYRSFPITITGLVGLYYFGRNDHVAFWFFAPTIIAVCSLMFRQAIKGDKVTSEYAATEHGSQEIGKNWRQDFFTATLFLVPVAFAIIHVWATNIGLRFFAPLTFLGITLLGALLTILTIAVEKKFDVFVHGSLQSAEKPFHKLKFFTKSTFLGGVWYLLKMAIVGIIMIITFTGIAITVDLWLSPLPHGF